MAAINMEASLSTGQYRTDLRRGASIWLAISSYRTTQTLSNLMG
ncbi:hypothetical protein CLIM01_13153 [Colletotrichum limetticola]|uniref:Uncharacterized protein n=1 Tax=Colletotrichum limetticola TaxID=1209924 RepID=A0ABQ9PBK1_9PEZI|nr:hypothetical protein CLIM01_13153 [Colletotrichum limetticola]